MTLLYYRLTIEIQKLSELTKTESICFAYKKAWEKKIHTYDKSVIFNCQYFCGYLPLDYQLDMRKLIFLKSLFNYPDPCVAKLFDYFFIGNRFHDKYDILVTDSISCIKLKYIVTLSYSLPSI